MSELTEADVIVLRNLNHDIRNNIQDSSRSAPNPKTSGETSSEDDDESVRPLLEKLSVEAWAFTSWDRSQVNPTLDRLFIQPYLAWASEIVRQKPDTVFITHLLVHYSMLLPSAAYLYYNFTWLHAVLHTVFAVWNAGPFTLLLHNHIHNNGILDKQYALFDRLFPYITGPLMGHTWDSYFYHHVKMHHVEGNGPEDLSSTIYYQRDEPLEFLKYLGRFLIYTWIQLPIYFFRNKKYVLATKSLISECSSMCLMYFLAWLSIRPTTFVLILPWFIMRCGMMVGNWGQHCLVDNVEPLSDFRSSITLIDVSSNRHCFNDGYHTSHHLNPRRHWKAHPSAFLKAKAAYQSEGALTFTGIDYLMITYRCLTQDYDALARHLVPMGAQIGMSHAQKMELLRTKTRKFTAADIQRKFLRRSPADEAAGESTPTMKAGASVASPQRMRAASLTLAASKAKAAVGESSGIMVNPDLLSQRI